jgi:sugar-phosphatase
LPRDTSTLPILHPGYNQQNERVTETTTITARAILFDMDGTLVDSTALVERVWGEFSEKCGLDIAAVLAFAHGRLAIDTVRHFLPTAADPQALTAAIQSAELAQVDGIVAIPGAAALLADIPAGAVALVTSAPRGLAVMRMAAAGLPFPAVSVAAEDVSVGKPSPEGYLRAAIELGVDARETIVFEDAPAGLAAGRASGATTIVVGQATGKATEGLVRVADFTALTVEVLADGALRLHLPIA